MKNYLFLIFLVLTGCDVMKSEKIQNTSPKSTIYPISDSSQCNAIPQDKQEIFLKNFEKLKLGMLSTDVVDLLEISPNKYGGNQSKSLNAPIRHYSMGYYLDCSNREGSFIFVFFSTDEKLKKIMVGKNVNMPNLDGNIAFEKSNY